MRKGTGVLECGVPDTALPSRPRPHFESGDRSPPSKAFGRSCGSESLEGAAAWIENALADDRHRTIPENTLRDPLPTSFLADAAATSGALTFNGSSVSLQLPLDSTLTVARGGTRGTVRDIATFRFFGTLNATGVIPEPSTWAWWHEGGAGRRAERRQRHGLPARPQPRRGFAARHAHPPLES